MIEAVEIENFQGHQYSLLEFSPGLNAIVGPSDQGKSAIFRSIDWCIENEPSGLDFRSWFAKKNDLTIVTVSKSNGIWVSRERSESVNQYKLWNKKDPLEAFGQGSVKEVLEAFDFSTFAIRGQYDQYFLLQSSPPDVSRFLNELTGLSISDDLIKKVNSIIHKANSGITDETERIEALSNEIKEYDYLDQLEIELNSLEKALIEREIAREERRLVLEFSQKAEEANNEIKELTEWLEIEKDTKTLINDVQDLNIIVKEKDKINQLINRIMELNEEIREFDEEVKDHQVAIQLQQDMKNLYRDREDLRILKECTERLDDLGANIAELDLRLRELKEEKDQYGIICQNCGARVELC